MVNGPASDTSLPVREAEERTANGVGGHLSVRQARQTVWQGFLGQRLRRWLTSKVPSARGGPTKGNPKNSS